MSIKHPEWVAAAILTIVWFGLPNAGEAQVQRTPSAGTSTIPATVEPGTTEQPTTINTWPRIVVQLALDGLHPDVDKVGVACEVVDLNVCTSVIDAWGDTQTNCSRIQIAAGETEISTGGRSSINQSVTVQTVPEDPNAAYSPPTYVVIPGTDSGIVGWEFSCDLVLHSLGGETHQAKCSALLASAPDFALGASRSTCKVELSGRL